jgi:hypothetical protein
MSAFGGKADMPACGANVCFRPKADIAVTGSDHVEFQVAVCHHVAANAHAKTAF